MGKCRNIGEGENLGLVIPSNTQFLCHSSVKEEGQRLDKHQGHNREKTMFCFIRLFINCTSNLLLHNQLPQNLAAQKTKQNKYHFIIS